MISSNDYFESPFGLNLALEILFFFRQALFQGFDLGRRAMIFQSTPRIGRRPG
jgi:hypothetical protein